ncbi:MAG: hypothetical protein ACXVYY_01395 [Oryzihumus sp.]
MVQSVVQGTKEGGFTPAPATPLAPVQRIALAQLGTREDIEQELDAILVLLSQLCTLEPDAAMRQISALSARCTELAVHLHRAESRDRQYTRIRTAQVQPILDDLKTQKEIAKGMVEMRRQDLSLL